MKNVILGLKSLVLTCLLASCVFLPYKESVSPQRCDVYKARWSLAAEPLKEYIECYGAGEDAGICMFSVGVVIPLGSLIISGSIVLIGNTLHWLERSGRCQLKVVNG